ncbi:MAG: peptidase U32 family protein [Fastidiosipilaceae bacterium]
MKINQEKQRKYNLPELLAPAGNFEKLRAVVLYGADAVYLAGEQYGLRAFADNFSLEEMRRAVSWAHERGVKVHVTLNIFAHPSDFEGLGEFVTQLSAIGVDAVLVSDPGVFRTVRKYAPELDIHISTQASTTNAEACRFWHDQGARRIVLARELTLAEIKRIREDVPADLELEVFVHGAMCMAYSGRCLLSNAATGRDANRGACAQPCRWKYYVTEEKRIPDQPGEPYTWEIQQDKRGGYFYSSRDICMIDHIPKLIEAGIDSLKIEGRMKGAFYGAMVTRQYRRALDAYGRDGPLMKTDPSWKEELERMVHRSYDTGFFFDEPLKDAKIAPDHMYHQDGVVVGVVLAGVDENGRVRCEQRNKIIRGDVLEVIQPRGGNFTLEVKELLDEELSAIEATPHPKQIFYLRAPEGVNPEIGSFIRRRGAKYGEGAGIGP